MSDNSKRLVILGAGSHGQVILDICRDLQIGVAGFLEDTLGVGHKVLDSEVIGGFSRLEDSDFLGSFDFIVGIGGSQNSRRKWSEVILCRGGKLRTIVHPSSSISRFARLGQGTLIWPNVTILHAVDVGDYCVVASNSSIGDESSLGTNAYIGGGCVVNFGVTVGSDVYLGSGTVVAPRCRIGARSVIALNSTIVQDVPEEAVMAGMPARVVRNGTNLLMDHIDNSYAARKT